MNSKWAKHKDKTNANRKAKRLANLEAERAKGRANYAANRERIAARRKARSKGGHTLPDGQRLRGVSTLYGAGGEAGGIVDQKWVKTERESDDPPRFDPHPPGHHVTSTATLVDGQGEVRAQWLRTEQDKVEREKLWIEAMRHAAADITANARAVPVPAPAHVDADWLAVYPWGDPHVGLLTWAPESGAHWDLSIAIRDYQVAWDLLVDSAPPAETALVINLGDYFHATDNAQRTPGHGHKLDVDGRWGKVLRAGLHLSAYAVNAALRKHKKAKVISVPGNHDPDAAMQIAIWLEAWFKDDPRVEILPSFNPYQIYEFGNNLILAAHGDGVKREGLPGLLATRWPLEWGRARYRRAYTGHIHHETEKEFPGMKVRSFGILPPKDAWHAHKGYDSEQTIEVIGHHISEGPRFRSMIDIHHVRAAQGLTVP